LTIVGCRGDNVENALPSLTVALGLLTAAILLLSGGAAAQATDSDGLSDAVEAALGTDPNNPDTDGDGAAGGDEIAEGTSPLDDTDFPDADGILDQQDNCLGLANPGRFKPWPIRWPCEVS